MKDQDYCQQYNQPTDFADLTDRLLKEGGSIVGSSELTQVEIAWANSKGRMFVHEEGFGYVHLPEGFQLRRSPGLSFEELRSANMERIIEYKNGQGVLEFKAQGIHTWTVSQWMMALVGEVGELANILKKEQRGDFVGNRTAEEKAQSSIENELADIQTYLDLLAAKCGVDLGRATVTKFNEVSRRVDSRVRLPVD